MSSSRTVERAACAIEILYKYPVRWTQPEPSKVATRNGSGIGRCEFMIVEVSYHHACSGTLECEAGLLRQMHANSLVTAASKGGQAHGPPKTPHLCVDRRIRVNKASYEKDVVTAEHPT